MEGDKKYRERKNLVMKAVRTGKKVFPLIAAIFLSILFFLPVEAGIWERHYWKGFLYIIDEYLKEGEKPEQTDIHNYYGKEEKYF